MIVLLLSSRRNADLVDRTAKRLARTGIAADPLVTDLSPRRPTVESINAARTVILFADGASSDLMAAAGYAQGIGKKVIVVAEEFAVVPTVLRDVPYIASGIPRIEDVLLARAEEALGLAPSAQAGMQDPETLLSQLRKEPEQIRGWSALTFTSVLASILARLGEARALAEQDARVSPEWVIRPSMGKRQFLVHCNAGIGDEKIGIDSVRHVIESAASMTCDYAFIVGDRELTAAARALTACSAPAVWFLERKAVEDSMVKWFSVAHEDKGTPDKLSESAQVFVRHLQRALLPEGHEVRFVVPFQKGARSSKSLRWREEASSDATKYWLASGKQLFSPSIQREHKRYVVSKDQPIKVHLWDSGLSAEVRKWFVEVCRRRGFDLDQMRAERTKDPSEVLGHLRSTAETPAVVVFWEGSSEKEYYHKRLWQLKALSWSCASETQRRFGILLVGGDDLGTLLQFPAGIFPDLRVAPEALWSEQRIEEAIDRVLENMRSGSEATRVPE